LQIKNRSCFLIADILTSLLCSHFTNAIFLVLTSEILGIWGLVIYRWKGPQNTFSTLYTPQKI
jgi:hypothetical protein